MATCKAWPFSDMNCSELGWARTGTDCCGNGNEQSGFVT